MKLILISLVLTKMALGYDCSALLAKAANSEFQWRASISHELSGGNTFPSDPQREADIKTSIGLMKKEIDGTLWGTNHPDTPPMVIVPTADTNIRFTQGWQEYGDMHAEVTGTKDGMLRATALLPVSGHTGLSNANAWAKTDTFTLTYKNGSGSEVTIVKDAKSLDHVTAQEIQIPLIDGQPVTLYYYRSGSGGPGGYSGGRVLHLTWKKSAALAPATDFTKPFWN